MKTLRLLIVSFFALSSFCLLPSAFTQGSLTPPGAPAPTMKTLDQAEPRIEINATNTPGDADSLFRISQPGAYYLTGNITGVTALKGIEIAASNVTIDLNGFLLMGVGGTLDGISASGTRTNITIRNGAISGFGQDGIDLFADGLCTGALLENLHVSNNTLDGITTGVATVVRNCTANGNGASGFNPLGASLVVNCSAANNIADGFATGTPGALIIGCIARGNDGDGFSVALGSLVADCAAIQNTGDGIQVFADCTVRGNTCTGNGSGGDGAGIHVINNDNRIEGNSCTDADRGIDVDAGGNFIVRNTCSGNTTNWDVVAGNVILVVTATTSPAVTGNAGGTAPGSTDPNANFTY